MAGPAVIEASTTPAENVAENSTENPTVRVLHVDDEQGFLKASKQILENAGGFEVDTALSVEEALEKMEAQSYDIILSDYQMPIKDGLEFLKELRKKENNIPFIIFTGKGREEVAIEALNLGADQYVNKIGEPETVYFELAHGIRRIVGSKRADEAMRESERKSRTLLENLPQKIFFKDKNSVYVSCNENYALDLKIEPDEIEGKTDYDFYPKELAEKYRADDKRIMESGKTENIEEAYIQSGKKVFVHTVKTPVRDENGSINGILGIFWDITERKKAEEALQDSEKKFKVLFENSPDGLFLSNFRGVTVDSNRTLAEMLSQKQKETVGKNFLEIGLLSKEEIPRALELLKKMRISKQPMGPVEFTAFRKDGRKVMLEVRIYPVEIKGETLILGSARDISERRKAEEELRKSQQKFKQLFLNNPEPTAYVDPDYLVLDINPSFSDFFGYSLEEIEGKHINDFVVPEHLRKGVDAFDKTSMEGYAGKAATRMKKDGSLVEVSISAAPLVVKRKLVGYVGVYKDISQLTEAERKLNETLEKLRLVGDSTRHDVRNKLSTIGGYTYLLKETVREKGALKHVNAIESAMREIEKIYDLVRTYEKIGVEKITSINAGETFETAVSDLSERQNITFFNECKGLLVNADSLFRQLFRNLIQNSIFHGETVKHIKLYFEEKQNSLKLFYEDDGVGIPKSEKENIFLEGYGRGSGFGLYLVTKMCNVYGWTIQETGKSGKGVQFAITIPKLNGQGKPNYKVNRFKDDSVHKKKDTKLDSQGLPAETNLKQIKV